MSRLLVTFILALALLVGCVAPGAPADQPTDAALTPVKLGVGFIPSVQFAPFYVGIEKGFFAEEGIDLTLDYGNENDYISLIGTGDWDFMVGSGDQVVLGRAQGLPVVYVARWFGRYPVVTFAKESANIREAADLAGKRVGLPGTYGANWIALLAMLDHANLTVDDIELHSIGFTQAAAISEDLVDAAVDYAVNGPVVLAQAGIATTQLTVDDYFKMPANGIVTSDMVVADNPDLVRRMVAASLRSIEYASANPDEAFTISLKFVPEAAGEHEAVNRMVMDASVLMWMPQAGMALGETTLEEWQVAEAFMRAIDLSPRAVDPATLFTNAFLPQNE